MRVISGSARGRTLKAPAGRDIRPTSDKVRAAIFNILVASADGPELEGARVLDLFAGTGALAIEALSRGAASAVLVDEDARALDALTANLASTKLAHRAKVMRRDLEKRPPADLGAFDVVFADPPYALVEGSRALAALAPCVAPGGVAVVEHDADTESPAIAGLVAADRREYGSTGITFYRRG